MKKIMERRLLSLILAAVLMLSLLPAGVLAADTEPFEETQKEPTEYADGAVYDEWEQDAETVLGTGASCELKDGKRHLKAGGGNANGNPYPAVFINRTMSDTLAKLIDDETAFLETTLESYNAGTDTRYGVYLNYAGPNAAFFVGADSGGWFWRILDGKSEPWYQGTRVPISAAGEKAVLRLEWKGTTLTKATVNGKDLFADMPLDFSAAAGNKTAKGVVGFKAAKFESAITEYNVSKLTYTNQATVTAYAVSGTVTDTDENAVAGAAVMVRELGVSAVTNQSGEFTLKGVPNGKYTLDAVCDGYLNASAEATVQDGNVENLRISMTPAEVETFTLHTDKMDVIVDKAFPRVIRYEMLGELAGKCFEGQSRVLSTIEINKEKLTPVVTSQMDGERAVNYTMHVESGELSTNISARLEADGNVLTFTITDVSYPKNNRLEHPVESIFIPEHSLISVNSTQTDAKVKAATLASSTISSGDSGYTVDESLQVSSVNGRSFRYVFLSNDELSAGISGNSDIGGLAASDNDRLTLSAVQQGEKRTVGAGSNLWFYDRKVSSSDAAQAAYANLTDGQKVVGIREGLDEQPYVKVVITSDENGDKIVDWQDGAVAARDQKVIHIPYASESIPDLVTTRIAMNFQSQATNPFLTTLDNVKRVALHSDGLGQSILLKGYANEGHDSGHPDYFDIGTRMGGAEDMKTMLVEGQKYGAEFGIHVNASEFYPEAKSFNEDMVKRSGKSLSYGWNWLDQGIGINGIYDLASGNRNERFDKLYEIVGDELDYVYVDVWGNGTSGSEDAWQTRKLSNEITGNSWRIVHEWGYANDWDSTFQHWVSDFTYGGYDNKGKYNSEVFRFLLNGSKDSFPPDFPTYGGAANAPLLGGAVMQGFEGWQGDVEYDLFIKTLYNQMLPAKFLQHYNIMKWVDSPNAVSIPYGTSSGGFSWNQKSSWTPEAQITLQNSDRTDTIVVTRGSDAEVNEAYAYGTEAEQLEYRSRYMTLNGRVILTGASDPGDFTSNAVDGNLKYLIPWYWDCNGDRLSKQEEKLYHYSLTGGESSWQLPEGWESLQTVKVFKLTDTGRTDEQTVSVSNGWVTLSAEADTPYVVVKGENGAQAPAVSWTAKGMHLSDVSFNNGELKENWTAEGTASVVSTDHEIRMLKLSGKSSVRQQLAGLNAGTSYAIYVGVDNRSDARASIAVLNGEGSTVASNYTLRSLGKNYVNSDIHRNGHSTEAGTSYFQNMYLFFTPEASQTYTLVLSREAGSGNTYFDDVRVVENASQNFTYDEDGNVTAFTQDFEHVAQGIYPFVIGPAQGVNDGRTHLSELHAPYTQAGWDVKKMDDVLNGSWSVKINGLTQHNGIIYYTIPQNFHFEAGKTYTVSFQYQMGSEGTYEVVYGSGEYTDAALNVVPLSKSLGETATCTFTMIGDESGQSWFGIRSTSKAANTQGTSGAAANFGGYSDFVLDDLSIRLSSAQKKALSELVQKAEEYDKEDYEGNWSVFESALQAAKEVLAEPNATQEEVDAAAGTLEAAMNALRRYQTALKVTVMDENGKTLSGADLILEDESYMPTGSRGESDASGVYTFTALKARAYQLKVVCSGYDVTTAAVETLTADQTKQITVTLHKQQAATYTNDYNTGDVSMMKPMDGNAGDGQCETIEPVDFDGSGALKVTYQNIERNTVVDEHAVLQNGTVEFDVTPLVSGVRFGLTLRGKDLNNRIYVGPFDSSSRYGWNCFVGGEEAWSNEFAGPQLAKDVTRHYKVTLHDNSLSLWIDGVLVFENETISSNPTEAGFVGFNAGRNQGTQFIFDNLRIISDDPGAGIPVTGVTVAPEHLTLKAGETMRLEAKVEPQNATNRNVSWESSDPSVAVVDENGVVTAVGEGTARISAATEDGNFTASCSVTVNKADCMHNGGTEIRGAMDATILRDGYTGDVYCSLCGALLEKGHVIPRRLNDLVGIIMGGSDDFPFRDVERHAWYYESVREAWSNGLIDGVTATEFKPDNQLTVAQAIKLAAALHQMQKTGSVTLTNGSQNWYDSYVAYAVNNGVIEKSYVEWIKPRLAKVIQRAKEIKPDIIVFYHSCGYVEPLIPHLIEAGIDVLNPVQPECMDFEEIFRKYGDRVAFHGTIGTQSTMPFGTPADVKAAVKRNLDIAGPKGGLLVAPTHLLEPGVPLDNVVAYVDACNDYHF